MNLILELQPDQTRQYIDAETVFMELRRCRAEAAEVRGSMFWRTVNGADYLIRESSGGSQKLLGPLDDQTQQISHASRLEKLN